MALLAGAVALEGLFEKKRKPTPIATAGKSTGSFLYISELPSPRTGASAFSTSRGASASSGDVSEALALGEDCAIVAAASTDGVSAEGEKLASWRNWAWRFVTAERNVSSHRLLSMTPRWRCFAVGFSADFSGPGERVPAARLGRRAVSRGKRKRGDAKYNTGRVLS